MTVQHTVFVLKVLNGINAGASVRLKTGGVVIGSAMSSDIILYDENIADQHVQLLITPRNIILQPLAQPVFVGGVEVATDSVELKPYQVVKLGGVEFVVSDGKKIRINQTQKPQRDVAQAHSNEQLRKNKQTKQENAQAKQSLSNRTLLAIGLGMLLLANLLFFYPKMDGVFEFLGLKATEEGLAAELLQELGEQDFELRTRDDRTLVLSGYTDTAAERNALLYRLQRAGVEADVEIWAEADMLENALMVSKAFGEPDVSLQATNTSGTLAANGFVTDKTTWAHIRNTIFNDVGGVQKIDDTNLNSLNEYMVSFGRFIEKKGLSSPPELVLNNRRVIVNGEFTRTEIARISELKTRFVELHGDSPEIILNVVDVHEKFELAIQSVSVSDTPFLVSKDGNKYMEGSALGDNYFVKYIKPDHVVLTNNGRDIPFYFGIEEDNDDAAN